MRIYNNKYKSNKIKRMIFYNKNMKKCKVS